MVTYPKAEFNFIDVTAGADSNSISTSVKDFSNTALLKESIDMTAYGTMELNQFVLDGSRTIYPVDGVEDVPFFSDEKSGEEGAYAKAPTLEITFTKPHSSIGLTLYFAEDVPEAIRVTWYTLYGSKLEEALFYPDAFKYFCRKPVQNYGKILIEFLSSGWPYRYVKLNYVEYGCTWYLTRDNITKAEVQEEVDVTSATLPINTAQLEFIDVVGEFCLTKDTGLWKSLQKEQKVRLTEYVDEKPIHCGTFYLDEWNTVQNVVSFSMIDRVGLMDKTNFYGGRIYHDEEAGNIVADIMKSAGVDEYSIDEAVASIRLSGWLGIQTHREALQQVAFACGAVITCSRTDNVSIYKPGRYTKNNIGVERKFMGTHITLDEYVSGVSVTYAQYVPDNEISQIVRGILPAGVTRIEFSNPYKEDSFSVTVGTIQKAATNYVEIVMEAEGECTLLGIGYKTVENTCTASVGFIEAGEVENTLKFEGCSLVNTGKIREIAEGILNYYQLRHKLEVRYINLGEMAGEWYDIALLEGGVSTTGISSQTLDLTGGNIASAICRGYNRVLTENYYAGTELYAGEDGVL